MKKKKEKDNTNQGRTVCLTLLRISSHLISTKFI